MTMDIDMAVLDAITDEDRLKLWEDAEAHDDFFRRSTPEERMAALYGVGVRFRQCAEAVTASDDPDVRKQARILRWRATRNDTSTTELIALLYNPLGMERMKEETRAKLERAIDKVRSIEPSPNTVLIG